MNESLANEITERLGLLPNLYRLAGEDTQIAAHFWEFARFAYLDNPLPSLFKERLFVFLSRYCENRYCLARHAGYLVGSGFPAGDALSLLRQELPPADQLRARPCIPPFPAVDTPEEWFVLASAAHVFLQTEDAPRAHQELRQALGPVQYEHLSLLLTYIRSEHSWTALHPELTLEDDVQQLFAAHPALAEGVWNREARSLHAERRQALLLTLLQGQRQTSDTAAMMLAGAEAVGRFLNVDRAGFFEIIDSDTVHPLTGWTAGRLPLLDFDFPATWIGAGCLVEVLAGKTLGIEDTAADPLTADSRFGDIGVRSAIGAPIMRNGKWHAGFYVNHAEPRAWTADEIALVREVADITWDAVERARAEEALRKSEERLSFALGAGEGLGTWDWDIPNDRVYCDARFARLFSVDAASAAAGAPLLRFLNAIHADDRPRVAAEIERVAQSGADFVEEYRVTQRDGSVRWVCARGRCHLDAQGKPIRFPGVVFDITDRRRAEEQLREQWMAFDTALSHTPDFTYTFDLEGRFTYVNRALLSLWQLPLSAAVGKNFFDLNYPADLAARLQRQIQEVIDTRQNVRDETPFTGADGEPRLYEYIFVPVMGANGRVEAVAGSTRDITERKQTEERERETQAQLRESARLESLGVMAGGIAHDFNNLLVGILGNASLLVEVAPEEDRAIAANIVLAAERAADLTKQMLAYSGRGRFVIEMLDLNKLILENFTLLRASIPRTIRVELDLCAGDCFIEADRAQIQQIIMNLLINAAEAIGGSAGAIFVRTSRQLRTEDRVSEHLHGPVPPGEYVSMEIADNGAGIPAETLKKIFDPFFTTKFTGRGLGLAAVLGIVKGHSGDIEVRSQPGAGTTFTILLPSCASPVAEAIPPSPPAVANASGLTVLVADDEDIVLRTAGAGLRSRGYQVLTATDGAEALRMLHSHPSISLVILDLTMPVMSGDQAIPLIRATAPHVPIILSTGYNEAEISSRFNVFGIAGFLQKPYSVSTMVAKVAEVVEAQKKAAQVE